jgi:large subunit ribosomal protein L15
MELKLENIAPKKNSRKQRRRLGRGISAGQGASCGKGMRGQKARSGRSTRPGFEGGQNPLYRRVPKLKHFPVINPKQYTKINLKVLNRSLNSLLSLGEVNLDSLIGKKIVSNDGPLKILGDGKLDKPLTIKAARFTESAYTKILLTGGECLFEAKSGEEAMVQNFSKKIESFRNMSKGWDGYDAEPANSKALSLGKLALKVSFDVGFTPSYVAPSAEGGVAISFSRQDKYADLECFNDGDVLAVISDKKRDGHIEVWEVDASEEGIKNSLLKIREYVLSIKTLNTNTVTDIN